MEFIVLCVAPESSKCVIKRAVRPLKQKKDPVSIEMLLELCNMHLGNNDLLVVRDLTMILLSFAGFLRFDEVSSLLCSDVKIE
jgi:site-specific recombinase XerC